MAAPMLHAARNSVQFFHNVKVLSRHRCVFSYERGVGACALNNSILHTVHSIRLYGDQQMLKSKTKPSRDQRMKPNLNRKAPNKDKMRPQSVINQPENEMEQDLDNSDMFGIEAFQREMLTGTPNRTTQPPLSEPQKEKIDIQDLDLLPPRRPVYSDKIMVTPFGELRFDSDNIPSRHGEMDSHDAWQYQQGETPVEDLEKTQAVLSSEPSSHINTTDNQAPPDARSQIKEMPRNLSRTYIQEVEKHLPKVNKKQKENMHSADSINDMAAKVKAYSSILKKDIGLEVNDNEIDYSESDVGTILNSTTGKDGSTSTVHLEDKKEKENVSTFISNHKEMSLIDEQYFADISQDVTGDVHEHDSVPKMNIPSVPLYSRESVSDRSSDVTTEKEELDFIDEKYFGEINTVSSESELDVVKEKTDLFPESIALSDDEIPPKMQELNYVDEQYFNQGSSTLPPTEVLPEQAREDQWMHQEDVKTNSAASIPQMQLGIRDRIQEETLGHKTHETNDIENSSDLRSSRHGRKSEKSADVRSRNITKQEDQQRQVESFDGDDHNDLEKNDTSLSRHGRKSAKSADVRSRNITKQEERQRQVESFDMDDPQTAYDMAMKIRVQKKGQKKLEEDGHVYIGNVDSLGYRVLKDIVPDWSKIPREVAVKMLTDQILYDENDLIAINKPYGLPIHGGPGVAMSVGQLLPMIIERLNKKGQKLEHLFITHRVSQYETGVLLLAKTKGMTEKVQSAIVKGNMIKKYWAITNGVPSVPKATIDIPMTVAKIKIGGKLMEKMTLKPDYTEETKLVMRKYRKDVLEAVTNYKVLDDQGRCALIECKPMTGVKDQLRCHLSLGMNTPILGDHKYSHFTRMAPQRLHHDILEVLGIRQQKVRYVPMHLHCTSILLPEFEGGQNIFIRAGLPKHFQVSLRRLKLSSRKRTR